MSAVTTDQPLHHHAISYSIASTNLPCSRDFHEIVSLPGFTPSIVNRHSSVLLFQKVKRKLKDTEDTHLSTNRCSLAYHHHRVEREGEK